MATRLVASEPAQRRNVLEQGLVTGAPPLHALRLTFQGGKALCGAGTISMRVPGRFDPDSPAACPACAANTKL